MTEFTLETLPVDDLIDLSLVMAESGQPLAAQIAQMKAIGREPKNARAHVALAETLLRQGEYRAGFREHEWRSRLKVPDWSSPTPEWTGYRLPEEARLLVIADQGFGDTLMFARYLPWVRQLATRLALGVPPQMLRLFGHGSLIANPEFYTIFSQWDDAPPHAAHVRLSSLPYLAATTLDTIPLPTPDALHANMPPWLRDMLAQDEPGLLVGYCWHGREENDAQRNRSVPFDLMRPLINERGVRPVRLQYGGDDRTCFPEQPPLSDDWSETAAIIRHLDAVVTSDTGIAHLAGTLGVLTFVLLKHTSDWRYGTDGENSPWYPKHRLMRQRFPGNWQHPLADVRRRLRAIDRKNPL